MWIQLPFKRVYITPYFSAYVYFGQTAGWIKMPLGTEVDLGLGPGHNVLDGTRPAPIGKGHGSLGAAPLFLTHFCCGQTVAPL